jgi:hypothetical protein
MPHRLNLGCPQAHLTLAQPSFGMTPVRRRSMRMCGMSPEDLVAARQELIVQSIDLMRFPRRDILIMQRSQLLLAGLVIEAVVDWPWPAMKRWRLLGDPALHQE